VTWLVDAAAGHVEQAGWAAARGCYEQALAAIGGDSLTTALTVAALHLNLGAVCVQAGQTREARAHLEEAGKLYVSLQDASGRPRWPSTWRLSARGTTRLPL